MGRGNCGRGRGGRMGRGGRGNSGGRGNKAPKKAHQGGPKNKVICQI
jgi:hypothetical protein